MSVRRAPAGPPAPATEPSALDAGWLRSLLRHAVRCALASSLALAACESGGGDPAPGEMPAHLREKVVAECTEGQWRLAPGFELAREVDYIADRIDFTSAGLISEHGEPCASADDRELCESSLAQPAPTLGRHLVTTEGDQVRLWSFPAALTLFGDIDAPEEAMWLMLINGYEIPCDAKVAYVNSAFNIGAQRSGGGCGEQAVNTTVRVYSNGAMEESDTTTVAGGPTPTGMCGALAGPRSE